MKPRPYTAEEVEAIRATCRTETIAAVAERFWLGVLVVRGIAGLGRNRGGGRETFEKQLRVTRARHARWCQLEQRRAGK